MSNKDLHGKGNGQRHKLKRVRADQVRGNQIIEWCDRRARVIRTTPCSPRGGHPRQRGSHRKAVLITVMPDGIWQREQTLHYWAEELVTVLGWTFHQ